jgi:hypothetical protein
MRLCVAPVRMFAQKCGRVQRAKPSSLKTFEGKTPKPERAIFESELLAI